ncbi:MAG: tetratricopeptide repeat protein [Candidatus Zixiibacteriota bacterium]|nr:MAG: tetratricopeptide repeat protein [candidate division Zixibacteria bacterium]
MPEYFLTFVILLIVAAIFYLLYDRYFTKPAKTESELYIEALRDLLDGRQESAFTKLRQVVIEDSDNIDAYIRLGQILRDNKKPDRALQVHKDLTLRTGLSPSEKAEILHQLYADYLGLNDLDMAQAALKELVTIKPRDRWGYVKLLDLQKKAKAWDEAYDTAVMLLKLEGNKSKKPLAAFKYHMGEALLAKREHHKARILFKEALGFDPTFVQAYLAIGDSYYEEKRFEDAVNFWNKLISAVPDEGHRVIERLKKTLFDLGRYGEINSICEDILKHAPKNLDARLCLAEFYEKKGDSDLAEQILVGIVDDYPEELKAVTELIRIYLQKGDNRKAETLVRDLEQKRQKLQFRSSSPIADTSLIGISKK